MAMKKVKIQRVDTDNFKSFGQLIRMPKENEESPTASGDSYLYHGVLAVMDCTSPVQFGLYRAEKKDTTVKQLEAHRQTEELLFALDGGFIVPAAGSKQEHGTDVPDCDRIRGFMVAQGEGVVFKKGTWHCSPIPATGKCTVLVAFRHNTHIEDVTFYTPEENISLIDA